MDMDNKENLSAEQDKQLIVYSSATNQIVKNTIFRDATDEELQLYYHKCISVGCHPLDRLIIPSKFNDGHGGKTIVFITTIDLFRARAEDTTLYDGQDEPEFEYKEHKDSFEHPAFCRVKIYKKDISRPFVGTADWNEFFPSDEKKQFMWKKLGKVMLSKCAEAQGLRKAFPQQLNKLYAEEEMQQAIDSASTAGKKSTKPEITQQTVPAGREITVDSGVVESVEMKTGKNKSGDWARYGIKIDGKTYGTFDKKIGESVKKGDNVSFEWAKEGKYKNIIQLSVVSVKKEDDLAQSFPDRLRKLAAQTGCDTDEKINTILNDQFNVQSINFIKEDQQSMIIDLFVYRKTTFETPGA